ncbi:MAG: GYD family protein [Dehalococcoidia bacterium SM23_28_2]|nr:MAG: GYD family protein [Dehalococcoidia bacterium SM23_28_2]
MATYVSLIRFTDQGVRNVKDVAERIAAAEKLFERVGARLSELYMTMGPYDYVGIIEAPDDETATKAALAVSSLGNVRTETMRAYTRPEIRKLISGLA